MTFSQKISLITLIFKRRYFNTYLTNLRVLRTRIINYKVFFLYLVSFVKGGRVLRGFFSGVGWKSFFIYIYKSHKIHISVTIWKVSCNYIDKHLISLCIIVDNMFVKNMEIPSGNKNVDLTVFKLSRQSALCECLDYSGFSLSCSGSLVVCYYLRFLCFY